MSTDGSPRASAPISVGVWGTGNMGRAAIRSVMAHPQLGLTTVLVSNPNKVGVDAGDLSGMPSHAGVAATDQRSAISEHGVRAVAYMASGDLRPDDALDDICGLLESGVSVVTPSLYALYDRTAIPDEMRVRLDDAISKGSSRLFVSGVDPGWANDILPILLSGVASEIEQIRSQEIFDYSTYDQPDSVRMLVGMGEPMDYEPPMVAPSIPSMVWGGQIRMIARALGVTIDSIEEHVERRPLEHSVENQMGRFDAGTQGALRFEVLGMSAGVPVIVIEHVTRITPDTAPDWPKSPAGAAGTHRVKIFGNPSIEVSLEALAEDGNNAAGGNATAAGRLVNAIPWLLDAAPGIYDALDVPLSPAVGRLGTKVAHGGAQ